MQTQNYIKRKIDMDKNHDLYYTPYWFYLFSCVNESVKKCMYFSNKVHNKATFKCNDNVTMSLLKRNTLDKTCRLLKSLLKDY